MTVLLCPHPLPRERLRPGVGVLVLGLHLGLLWLANLYWPLQSVLFNAVQSTAQSITVQILQKTNARNPSADNNAALNTNPQGISNPGRQRFGRAEAMLELPAAQTEASTPLAGTVQIAQATQPVPSRPVVVTTPTAQPAKPVPQAVATPERAQPDVVSTVDDKLPEPAPSQPIVTPASLVPPSPATATAPLVAPAAPAITVAPAPVSAAPAFSPSTAVNSPVMTTSSPGAVTASGAALASGSGTAVPGSGNAAASVLSSPAASGAGAPLNLNLPPRYTYRPPLAVPRRSLSEMANEQLRRKPRDPFAEGIEGAGNIDCLKDTPEGPAQGLLAVGPLLKRAIEEKCRK